jgi:hypothetical protein
MNTVLIAALQQLAAEADKAARLALVGNEPSLSAVNAAVKAVKDAR